MENNTSRNLNYNFIAVPTNLYFALDLNLRNALTVLLQLSSIYSDSNGFFFRTIADLKEDFKVGKNLTIAILESLYRYELLQVKKTNKVNLYRIRTEKFKDFEQNNLYTITNNSELQLTTVNYKDKDFKTTYNDIPEPRSVQNQVSEETPTQKAKNVSERQEIGSIEITEETTPNKEILNDWYESVKEDFEVTKQTDFETACAESITIETASVVPTQTPKIERRNLDVPIVKRCEDLVNRYVEMVIPSANESLEKCNQACDYIYKQWEKGFITEETRKELTKKLIKARFEKHRI